MELLTNQKEVEGGSHEDTTYESGEDIEHVTRRELRGGHHDELNANPPQHYKGCIQVAAQHSEIKMSNRHKPRESVIACLNEGFPHLIQNKCCHNDLEVASQKLKQSQQLHLQMTCQLQLQCIVSMNERVHKIC
jgi:hypothetical protein